ncbi:MAG: GNAT family N-acetyltransferase [Clostridia bacterium]|nr:GNAT family N-acetyltransferase [Clostridia bacterium]MBQ7052476.1 GNAT family N-acetyltransferase [Clostridia bacterium]
MVELRHIGKSADDLRFFILMDGRHAGGITVHSAQFPSFSYGVAVAKDMRRKGAAKAALLLLFDHMKRRGFARACVQIESANAASLALHSALGFAKTGEDNGVVLLERAL